MQYFVRLAKHFYSDSLYRNSVYLMISTFILAFFGFIFWSINARIYNSQQIGIATTLISTITLIANFSLLGFNNSLIKYLPQAKNKNAIINTSFFFVGSTAGILAIIFILGVHIVNPKLAFVSSRMDIIVLFIASAVITSLNMVSDNIFIAYRSTIYILIYNILQNIPKLLLPFILLSYGAFGIFLSVQGGILLALLVTVFFLIWKFQFRLDFRFHKRIVKETAKYSLKTYIVGIAGSLPGLVLPTILINRLNPSYAAYFYFAMMIANVLYIIPAAASRSMFAEGSYKDDSLSAYCLKSIKLTFITLLPAVLIIVFWGQYILLVFGKEYSSQGFALLQLLALTSFIISINSILSSVLYIKNAIGKLFIVCFTNSFLILASTYLFLNDNLVTLGVIWIISHTIMMVLLFVFTKKYIFR